MKYVPYLLRVFVVSLAANMGLSCPRCDASVLYTTFGSGYTYLSWCYGVDDGPTGYQAFLFVPAQSGNLGTIKVALGRQDASTTQTRFDLYQGTPTSFGALLETFLLANTTPPGLSGGAVVTLTSASHPILNAGTNYWLSFCEPDPPNGSYSLWFNTDQSLYGTRMTFGFPAEPGYLLPAFSVEGSPLSTVTGHVLCACDNSAVANATVQLTNSSRAFTTTSTGDGTYAISNVPPGSYTAAVSRPAYYRTNFAITIPSDYSTVTTNLTLKPDGSDTAKLRTIVNHNTVIVGTLDNETGAAAEFTPPMPLSTAACLLGYDHFNWYQLASSASYYQVGAQCYPNAFFVDPPHTYCLGLPYCFHLSDGSCAATDEFDPYYNEGPNYPGVLNITSRSPGGATLRFSDHAMVNPNDTAWFYTSLIGVKDPRNYRLLYTWQWKTTFTGTSGGVIVIAASEWYLTNGVGSANIVQTNVAPADLPAGAVPLIISGGGGFPVTIQPPSQVVVTGTTNVTFAAFPTNASSSLNYQWRKNRNNISGATNSTLVLSIVTTNDAAIYDAVLTSSSGSIASATATLSVVTAPLLLSPLMATNGQLVLSWITCQGNTYQLQYKTNLAQANWINVGSPVPAYSTTVFLTNSVGSDPQRFYMVRQQ